MEKNIINSLDELLQEWAGPHIYMEDLYNLRLVDKTVPLTLSPEEVNNSLYIRTTLAAIVSKVYSVDGRLYATGEIRGRAYYEDVTDSCGEEYGGSYKWYIEQ